jgi:hypothetical protein
MAAHQTQKRRNFDLNAAVEPEERKKLIAISIAEVCRIAAN